ncbi:hypothetical protein PYCC9005_003092 [Savitreella phatthalungensis]
MISVLSIQLSLCLAVLSGKAAGQQWSLPGDVAGGCEIGSEVYGASLDTLQLVANAVSAPGDTSPGSVRNIPTGLFTCTAEDDGRWACDIAAYKAGSEALAGAAAALHVPTPPGRLYASVSPQGEGDDGLAKAAFAQLFFTGKAGSGLANSSDCQVVSAFS